MKDYIDPELCTCDPMGWRGQGFGLNECEVCADKFMSNIGDKVCPDCSSERNLCQACGKEKL